MNVRRALPILLPVVLAIVTGLPGVNGGLIRDDTLYITQNPTVTEPTSLSMMFRTPFQPDHELGLYRPLTTLTLRTDFVLSDALGLPITRYSAPMAHITNLLLAAIATVLVFCLARELRFSPVAAGMGAALFAVHPARTESVIWISGRAECLMTMFALGCLVVAARGASRWRGPVAGLLCLLSFFSKEQALVLAVLVPILPRLARRDRVILGAWIWGALAAGYAWRTHVIGEVGPVGGQQVLDGWSFLERIPLGLAFLGNYVRLALWPHPLLNEYDDPTSVAIGFAIIGAAFVGLFVWRCFKDGRDAFLLGLFAGPLAIVLNVLYRTGETFAERFLALPIAGAVLMIVRLAAHRPRLGGSALFTATCICAVLTARRAGEYRDDEILTAATVRDAPEMSAPLRLLSGVYRRDRATAQEIIGLAKQDEDAKDELVKITSLREGERALVEELLAPDYGAERLAKIAEERQLRKKMYDTMRAGIRLNPDDDMLRIDLARELKNEGMPRMAGGAFDLLALQEAERHVRHVIERSPAAYEARNLLAEILLARAFKLAGNPQAKMLAEAEHELRETLRIEPRKDTAGQDLARLLLFHKRTHEAIEFLKRQREVFRDLGERRWWDPRGLQLEASVLRSIAQLQGEASAGMLTGLPLLFEALDRSVSAPWRVRLLQTNLLPTLRELSRSPANGQRQWLREAADLLESEIAKLTSRVDGPACLRSDLMSAIAKLELERNDRAAAARWFERAAKASDLPEVRHNLLRTAAHLWQRHAVVTPPGARIDALRHATRLRRAMYDTR